MHGILSVGGLTQCAFSLQSFITGIRRGVGITVRLRPNPRPRIEAFQQQLLGLMRLSQRQAQLTMETLTADPANKSFQHQIDIKVITDGEHHVLDQLDPPFRGLFQMVVAKPRGQSILALKRRGSWLVASMRLTTCMPISKMI